jgi:spermidine synthase
MHLPLHRWTLLLCLSGAVGLAYELVWLRRLGLVLGGSSVAGAFTVGAFLAGLGLGAAAVQRVRPSATTPTRYATLEAAAAAWALAFPAGYALLTLTSVHLPWLRWLVAGALLLPPAAALGATWPLLSAHLDARGAARLYVANTVGAVTGVLLTTFVALPHLGVRGTELAAAACGLLVAALATRTPLPSAPAVAVAPPAPRPLLWAIAAASGATALGLEMVWFRLAAVAFGATVQTIGGVLACFLLAVAAGAEVGRRWPGPPERALPHALTATALTALVGALAWSQLPFLYAAAWRLLGADGLLPASLLLALLAMGGAPVASGAAFVLAVRSLGPAPGRAAGPLYAANTLGCIAGAWVGGLWALPALQLTGSLVAFASLSALAACAWSRRPWPLLVTVALGALLPAWDARLFAVGVHLRISDFADPSRAAVQRFVDEGWELLSYEQGATAAVAVGRSLRTGNVWLSVNGKVDASTGDDMPTQELSATLPLAFAPERPLHLMVVGLASGVTAGRALDDPRVRSLTLLELEPAMVRASHAFDHVNGRPLDDPRTHLALDDARAWLARGTEPLDLVISEPSNPWISGVSNLFTLEYWRLARGRLAPDGVFCQWVQLYGMGPSQLLGLLRTFDTAFDDVWVFETVPGADLVLVGVPAGTERPEELSRVPLLTPDEVRCLTGRGETWLNTDDRPRVEWEAPAWLHYATAADNRAQLTSACSPRPSPASSPAPGPR